LCVFQFEPGFCLLLNHPGEMVLNLWMQVWVNKNYFVFIVSLVPKRYPNLKNLWFKFGSIWIQIQNLASSQGTLSDVLFLTVCTHPWDNVECFLCLWGPILTSAHLAAQEGTLEQSGKVSSPPPTTTTTTQAPSMAQGTESI
jgi:hypothetical protein